MTLSRLTPVVELAIVEPEKQKIRVVVQSDNPRVQVYPSADGVVLLVGVTLAGKWVAEYRCLAEDFDERCVLAMERRVRAKERTERPRPQLI